jgi:hypothetical protein
MTAITINDTMNDWRLAFNALDSDYRSRVDIRQSISVVDSGGDGSLVYNTVTGVITYTGPSEAEIRAHFAGSPTVDFDSSTGVLSVIDGSIVEDKLGDSSVGSAKLKNATSLIIYNSDGEIVKTLWGAGT